jgi:hypothetical protein
LLLGFEQKLEKTADNFRKVVADFVALIRFPVCYALFSLLACWAPLIIGYRWTCGLLLCVVCDAHCCSRCQPVLCRACVVAKQTLSMVELAGPVTESKLLSDSQVGHPVSRCLPALTLR